MVKARKWILVKHFEVFPKDSDLKLVDEELPPLKDGEVLLEAVFFSVDPYMRIFSAALKEGDIMMGSQIAKVIESKHPDHPVGKHFIGDYGWRDKTIINLKTQKIGYWLEDPIQDLYDMGSLSKSLGLGVLGMPGATAYFGLLELCAPKKGEVVVVNAAAGAVGSIVGQIAKIQGCTAIGFAGSEEKVKYLKDLGFDHAFNYKTKDVGEALKEAAPNGVDCYFDNVGGKFTETVLQNMNLFGRIAVCGSIETYNSIETPKGPYPWMQILSKQLRVEGLVCSRWNRKFFEAFKQNQKWMEEGKLKYREHMTQGFENMQKAFHGVLKGENIGKAVVKA